MPTSSSLARAAARTHQVAGLRHPPPIAYEFDDLAQPGHCRSGCCQLGQFLGLGLPVRANQGSPWSFEDPLDSSRASIVGSGLPVGFRSCAALC